MLYKIDPKTNEVVKVYLDVKQACEDLLVPPAGIRRAIVGRQATSHGYRWAKQTPTCKAQVRNRLDELRANKELSEQFDYLD
ncbi:winged helix-turn-helix DNA-binding domain protein [Vibrio phage 1.076.O._10N.286.51.B7]|nr:winged helix-turn-helix DNA-binding domain protein [Vibrio phage 1.076.O._10N.286.51.B7]